MSPEFSSPKSGDIYFDKVFVGGRHQCMRRWVTSTHDTDALRWRDTDQGRVSSSPLRS